MFFHSNGIKYNDHDKNQPFLVLLPSSYSISMCLKTFSPKIYWNSVSVFLSHVILCYWFHADESRRLRQHQEYRPIQKTANGYQINGSLMMNIILWSHLHEHENLILLQSRLWFLRRWQTAIKSNHEKIKPLNLWHSTKSVRFPSKPNTLLLFVCISIASCSIDIIVYLHFFHASTHNIWRKNFQKANTITKVVRRRQQRYSYDASVFK